MNISNIRLIRKSKKESQEDVAQKLGISQRLYSWYETGKVRFPLGILVNLANSWGITLDELIDRGKAA